jgi:epoxyqueuosine reductase QueG
MGVLEERITQELVTRGASIVGFADLEDLPPGPRKGMSTAVWMAVALDPLVVAGIEKGPTKLYEIEYNSKNQVLGELTRTAVNILRAHGFEAIPRAATDEDIDWIELTTPLPHKTVATRAGMGWIGKCGLLVTREFGSAIRMAVVLTDAYLDSGTPIGASFCGDCDECVVHCPADAPLGEDWIKRMAREEFYDAHACHDKILEFLEEKGLRNKICGICIAVCPWTKKYVRRATKG